MGYGVRELSFYFNPWFLVLVVDFQLRAVKFLSWEKHFISRPRKHLNHDFSVNHALSICTVYWESEGEGTIYPTQIVVQFSRDWDFGCRA